MHLCFRMKPILALLALPLFALAQSSDPPGLMTNQRVVQLVQSGVRTDELSRLIVAAPSVSFNLTPADTDRLLRAGVSEETIKTMSSRETGSAFTTSHARIVQPAKVEHGFHVTYNGGSVPAIRAGSALTLFIDDDQIRFFLHRNWYDGDPNETEVVTIPARAITEVAYGRDAHRRVGTAIAVSTFSFGLGALTVLSTSKKHYLGVTWANGEQRGGIAVQCGKGDYRGILEAIEGITGKKVVESASLSVKN